MKTITNVYNNCHVFNEKKYNITFNTTFNKINITERMQSYRSNVLHIGAVGVAALRACVRILRVQTNGHCTQVSPIL